MVDYVWSLGCVSVSLFVCLIVEFICSVCLFVGWSFYCDWLRVCVFIRSLFVRVYIRVLVAPLCLQFGRVGCLFLCLIGYALVRLLARVFV